ncbi:IBR domain-containing protein, putative [Eimeria maxima]|uniref:RBR-type E3 ubiquitin transferase n=1 Tax=Eimeria maxima TaxID=5804 RepID=U6MBK3_EIMMA|nr:IBR domain-containing protein, putative [Eimeria maxima]CDJ59864.1 IBR domain-containing protein, putative [Eimeria maxima]
MEVLTDDACAEDCEIDDFLFDDDELMASAHASPKAKGLVPRYHSPESLDRRIDELVHETAGLMGLNEAVVGILLRAFDWRSDALVQEWFNDGAAVLRKGRLPPELWEAEKDCNGAAPVARDQPSDLSRSEAHQGSTRNPPSSADAPSNDRADDMFECPVTANLVPLTDTFALKCNHRFSNAAWIGYLDALVAESPQRALDARCPFPGCLEIITMDVWHFFRGPTAVARLRMFAREQFVGKHLAVAWCPSPTCEQAVELVPAAMSCSDTESSFCNLSAAEVAPVADVTCSCGTRFCVLCGNEPHRPISCRVIAAWMRKNRGGESQQNGGNADAQHSLERYAHFFERYRAHNHGQQVATRMQSSQLHKCREVAAIAAGAGMRSSPTGGFHTSNSVEVDKVPNGCGSESSSPSIAGERSGASPSSSRDAESPAGFGDFDWDFLEKGWLQVVECRRMLKWSYAFAFFAEFPETRQKHLFEFHQGQLERSLDLLQERLETFEPKAYIDRDPADLIAFKMQLLDLTAVVRGFFAKICDVFEDEFVADAVHVNDREAS